MAVWDAFLTEDDKKVMAARKPRPLSGAGSKIGVLVIDMQNTAHGIPVGHFCSGTPRSSDVDCKVDTSGSQVSE